MNKKLAILIAAVVGLVVTNAPATTQTPTIITPLSLTNYNTYSQDFNTLASTLTSSTVPPGWGFVETGTAENTTYTAGTGSSTTGDTYSFGATSSTERAFGGLLSGALNPTVGALFSNGTGSTVISITITYTGEEWRLGAISRTDRLDFQYQVGATNLTSGTWVDFDSLDFTTPNTATAGAHDGNLVANQTLLSATITGLSIPNGTSFGIRWADSDVTGSDDGLAVDNFLLAIPEPSTVFSGVLVVCGLVWHQRRRLAGLIRQTSS